MPYTKPTIERDEVEATLRGLNLERDGDLTWAMAILMDQFALNRGVVNYANLHAIRACAIDAADEWWWAVMRPYEDQQRVRNGTPYSIRAFLPQSL